MTDHILFNIENQIATITLNRSEVHNAFNEEVIADLTRYFQTADQDPSVRLIILNANGKSFSAGADLEWMKRMAEFSEQENFDDSLKLAELLKTIHGCQTPTMAIVDGATYGGGVGLTCACDIVLGTDKASFCLSEVKLGLIPAVISPYVVKAIGERQSKRLFISAEIVDAKEAHNIGLLTHLTDQEKLADKTAFLIKLLMKGSPTAQSASKDLVHLICQNTFDDRLITQTAKRIANARASNHGKEGVQAFLSKTKPSWVKE